MPDIRATPEQRPALGAIARLLRKVDEFGRAPFGYSNPPVEMLSDVLRVPELYRTLENAAYGSPLTRGTGQARVLTPDTKGAAEALLNLSPGLAAGVKATKDLPVGLAIKPKGGNWLSGSTEMMPSALKRRTQGGLDPQDALRQMGENYPVLSPYQARVVNELQNDAAINKWLDTKLEKYIRNELATPEDPLRALAERGISHVNQDDLNMAADWVPDDLGGKRVAAGYPEEGFTLKQFADEGWPPERSDAVRLATGWENMADIAIDPMTAQRVRSSVFSHSNPWVSKLNPEAKVYGIHEGSEVDLGFNHLVDEMRNALNPESGLPRQLMLEPKHLERMTVPQIVEHVSKVNAWRAAQKAEADALRANNAATVLHKEYPEGFRWVELRPQEGLKDLYHESTLDEYNKGVQTLSDALKYEGSTMGHCVGGYCPDVLEGRSRIFSLRDQKGMPHVTIEVQPEPVTPYDLWYSKRSGLSEPDAEYKEFMRWVAENDTGPVAKTSDLYEAWAKATGRQTEPVPQKIIQIKGKSNLPPKEDYLPFVRDFVKSEDWSKVGDLHNAGLRLSTDIFNTAELKKIGEAGLKVPRYLTKEEIDEIGNKVWPQAWGAFPSNYAHGGSVEKGQEMDSIEDLLGKYAELDDGSDPLFYEERARGITSAPPLSDENEAARMWLESKMAAGAGQPDEAAEPIIDLGSLHAIKLASDPLMTPTPEGKGFLPDARLSKNAYYKAAVRLATKYGLPPEVFTALVNQESRFNPNAYNKVSGATGLTQLIPTTASDLKVNIHNPLQNLEGGAKYLSQMVKKFGSIPLALAAYNAGPGRVAKAGNVIPAINETREYVKNILSNAGMTSELEKFADQLKAVAKKKKATTPKQDAATRPALKKAAGGSVSAYNSSAVDALAKSIEEGAYA